MHQTRLLSVPDFTTFVNRLHGGALMGHFALRVVETSIGPVLPPLHNGRRPRLQQQFDRLRDEAEEAISRFAWEALRETAKVM